jgi:hypothetical protein
VILSLPNSFEKQSSLSSQVDGMKKRTTTAGKTVKARARGSFHLKRPTASKTIATHFSASKKTEIAGRPRTAKSLRRDTCAKVAPRVVDFLAILVAGVASFAIIINAVFLQSDRGIYEPEQPFAKLQRTQQSLKFEGERLQHKIDTASTRN